MVEQVAGEREVAVGDVFVELLMDTAACVIGRCGGEEEEEEEEESAEVLRLTASIWWREVEAAWLLFSRLESRLARLTQLAELID